MFKLRKTWEKHFPSSGESRSFVRLAGSSADAVSRYTRSPPVVVSTPQSARVDLLHVRRRCSVVSSKCAERVEASALRACFCESTGEGEEDENARVIVPLHSVRARVCVCVCEFAVVLKKKEREDAEEGKQKAALSTS